MTQFRPMLGGKIEDFAKLKFPLFASIKLDGVRAIWYGKEFMSRTLKTIPNRSIQASFSKLGLPSGWDGELIMGEPNASDVYRKTVSSVMSIHGVTSIGYREGGLPWVRFFVFDNCEVTGGFADRIATVSDIGTEVVKLDQLLIENLEQLLALEERTLREGYEGLILRSPMGAYKNGRSTFREQYMLKLKRFTDAEATVVGYEELLHNSNDLRRDERGYAKRSSHQENKVPMGVLGSLVCECNGIRFNIGTGFTGAERAQLWGERELLVGRLAKFKSLEIGVKTAPRHPVFLGWRDKIDK